MTRTTKQMRPNGKGCVWKWQEFSQENTCMHKNMTLRQQTTQIYTHTLHNIHTGSALLSLRDYQRKLFYRLDVFTVAKTNSVKALNRTQKTQLTLHNTHQTYNQITPADYWLRVSACKNSHARYTVHNRKQNIQYDHTGHCHKAWKNISNAILTMCSTKINITQHGLAYYVTECHSITTNTVNWSMFPANCMLLPYIWASTNEIQTNP